MSTIPAGCPEILMLNPLLVIVPLASVMVSFFAYSVISGIVLGAPGKPASANISLFQIRATQSACHGAP